MQPTPLVRLLGPVTFAAEDGHQQLASGRQRALLALLALDANRLVPAERLIDRLWADDLPTDPSAALRTQVSRLRRALGTASELVITSDGGYRLAVEADEVDLHRFERLVAASDQAPPSEALDLVDQALALWQGDPFDGVALELLEPIIVRLEERRIVARERRARALLDLGKPDVAALEEMLRSNPQREQTRALVMEALYVSGRHTDALAIYQEWRHHLAEEFGLEPSPALAAMELAILDHRLPVAAPSVALKPRARSLPHPATALIGRRSDLQAVTELLVTHRVITLCGTGGVGKTRLAIEVAAAIERTLEEVVFCDLSTIRTGAEVARVVALAVGAEDRSDVPAADAVAEHLDGRGVLVVLDNCEHVLDGAAVLVERVVARTKGPVVLATSRERLAVAGERLWAVEPLSIGAASGPAVELFVERARAAGVELDDGRSLDDVAALCARLDGLPLSIELAAAHVRSLGVRDLARSLEVGPLLLEGGRRTSSRHRSLSAVVAWSYDLLSAEERSTFDALAVFAGDFDIDAAVAVAGGPDAARTVVEGVIRLVETSLLVPVPTARGQRYRMLQTLRDHGIHHLREADREREVRDGHARWAVTLAEAAAAAIRTADDDAGVRRFAAHLDELRAAHAWVVGRHGDFAVRLVLSAHAFAVWHGHAEPFRWAEVAASALATSPCAGIAAVHASAAIGVCRRGDIKMASSLAALAVSHENDGWDGQMPAAASALGEVALMEGDLDAAVEAFTAAADLAVQAGDALEAAWNRGSAALALAYGGKTDAALTMAGSVRDVGEATGAGTARAFGEFVLGEVLATAEPAQALAHLERAVDLAERCGSAFVQGVAEVALASQRARYADTDAALRLYEQAILRWAGSGAWAPLQVTFRTLARLLASVGHAHDAATLLGASTRGGAQLFGPDQALVDALEKQLFAALGDDLANAASVLVGASPADAAAWALAAIHRAQGTDDDMAVTLG